MRGNSTTMKQHHRKIVKDYFKLYPEFETTDAAVVAKLLAMTTSQFFDALHWLTSKGWFRYRFKDDRVVFSYTQN